MTNITKETIVRAIIINIEQPHNAFVMDEVWGDIETVDDMLECYKDLKKFRIITV